MNDEIRPPEFSISSTTIVESSPTQSLVSLVLAKGNDANAMERMAITVLLDHHEMPLFAELQRQALRRARDAIAEQTQALARLVGPQI